MIGTVKIGCFIEPTGALKCEIMQLKDWSRLNFLGSQNYLDHPAHLTLFTLCVGNNSQHDIINTVNHALVTTKAFKIKTLDYMYFFDDALTNGHTFTIEVEKSNYLVNLQLILLKSFQHIREYNDNKSDVSNIKLFQENFNELGFPFAGKIWKPHFTITSCQKSFENELKLKNVPPRENKHELIVSGISFWEIEDDFHKKFYSVEFEI